MFTRSSTLALLALALAMAIGPTASIALADDESFDWDTWRRIPVLEGGRMKPLDTLAWEFVTAFAGRASYRPEAFSTISVVDISDWPKLAEALKSASKGQEPTPAKRVWELLTPKLKERLDAGDLDAAKLEAELNELDAPLAKLRKKYSDDEVEIETVEQLRSVISPDDTEAKELLAKFDTLGASLREIDVTKAMLILELNEIVNHPKLHDAAAWAKTELPEEAKKLLSVEQDKATPMDRARLNQLLVASAFPGLIKAAAPAATAFGTATIQPRKYGATELYVTWLLTWQGWDKLDIKEVSRMRNDEIYWHFHRPDVWDAAPMIDARHEAVSRKLKPETNKAASVRTVGGNKEFEQWVAEIRKRRQAEIELTPAEEKAVSAMEAYMNFLHLRLGFNMQVWPDKRAEGKSGVPLVTLLVDSDISSDYDSADIAKLREGFHQARQGLLENKPAAFNAGSKKFSDALWSMGKSSKVYPTASEITREVDYNRHQPFLWTAVLGACASVLLGFSLGVKSKVPYVAGYALLIGATGLLAYGMGMRVVISGRGPVTNMFETLVWSAFIASMLAVTLGMVYRHRMIPTTAAIVVTLSTLLAHNMPIAMGAAISPLQPVLRSNYWLVVHVMTIVASYGAFMQAWALGNVGLLYYILRKDRPDVIKPLALFTYRSMQVGILLLAAGTVLGGWWAADSWGRFWGWDPKEVWALIALLGYLALLHARFVGWVKLFGLLAGAVLAFNLIVMSWYGVNFLLGVGLHAYAFGDGGQGYVISAVILNVIYVIIAYTIHSATPPTRSGTQIELANSGAVAWKEPLDPASLSSLRKHDDQ